MEWFLINVLTPLLLPIFLIAIIGFIADVKPDAFIKIYIDIIQNILVAVFRCIWQVLKICFEFLWRLCKCFLQCMCCALETKGGTGKSGSTPCKPCDSADKSKPDKSSPEKKKRAPKPEPDDKV